MLKQMTEIVKFKKLQQQRNVAKTLVFFKMLY